MPLPMTRTPTQSSREDAALVAAWGVAGRVFESKHQRSRTEGIVRGYREKNIAASKPLPPPRAAETCRFVFARGVFSRFSLEVFFFKREVRESEIRPPLTPPRLFRSSRRKAERERRYSFTGFLFVAMPPSTDSAFYGVYLLNSRAVPNSKRTYIG